MKKKFLILLILMASTGCSRDLDFNPYTTMFKQLIKQDDEKKVFKNK